MKGVKEGIPANGVTTGKYPITDKQYTDNGSMIEFTNTKGSENSQPLPASHKER